MRSFIITKLVMSLFVVVSSVVFFIHFMQDPSTTDNMRLAAMGIACVVSAIVVDLWIDW